MEDKYKRKLFAAGILAGVSSTLLIGLILAILIANNTKDIRRFKQPLEYILEIKTTQDKHSTVSDTTYIYRLD